MCICDTSDLRRVETNVLFAGDDPQLVELAQRAIRAIDRTAARQLRDFVQDERRRHMRAMLFWRKLLFSSPPSCLPSHAEMHETLKQREKNASVIEGLRLYYRLHPIVDSETRATCDRIIKTAGLGAKPRKLIVPLSDFRSIARWAEAVPAPSKQRPDLWHFAVRPFVAACGADQRDQQTTQIAANVNCSQCLSVMNNGRGE